MADGPSKSLMHIDIDGKAAETLIKESSRGVEGLYRPRQILKLAKANAAAALIAAKSEIEISEIRQRAWYRLKGEAIREQHNLEKIAARTTPLLSEGATADALDDDWFANFRNHARLVSSEEMQGVWARVLAGEINRPGTFSRRAINALVDLDQRDCNLFTKLCGFCWCIIDQNIPLIYNTEDAIYADRGLHYGVLNHLENIGLISINSEGFIRTINKPANADYFGEEFTLSPPEIQHHNFALGKVILTKVGAELAPIAGAEPLPGFKDYVLHRWKDIVTPISAP